MAVDAAHVYWANSRSTGTIGRANLDGTGVDQSFITGVDLPGGVAVDAAHVYWTNLEHASARSGAPTSTARASTRDFIDASGWP